MQNLFALGSHFVYHWLTLCRSGLGLCNKNCNNYEIYGNQ